jgi:hypothetical protein
VGWQGAVRWEPPCVETDVAEDPKLPPGYYLERDADLLMLRGPDGTVVAVFSARGVAGEAIKDAAWEDHREQPS